MFPSALAVLVSAVCASGSGLDGDALAANSIQVPIGLIEEALPPPPVTVLLKTSYYGTVTVNHAAHLQRKAHCKDCHGPGPVSPIAFTPKVAHERCRGCHMEAKKGPTDCKGCHVLPPKGPAVMTAEAAPAADASGKVAASSGGGTLPVAGPGIAAGVVARPATSPAGPAGVVAVSDSEREAKTLHRTVQLGAAAGNGYGLSARLASHQGGVVLSFGIDRLGGYGPTRTALLVGAGARLPLRLPPALGLFAEGVAGMDAVSHPSVDVMPALGARLGLEWSPRWVYQVPLFFSVTGLMDAFHDNLLSPACLYATVGVGAPLQPR